MERAFKGVWIPKEIWLDKELGWSEKLLLVEINSLDNEEGCWASNEYFAEFFGLSKGRISKMISGLKKKDYITVDFIYKKGTKEIDRRIVKINHRYSRKRLGGVKENDDRGIGENVEDNNTSFNNTINNTVNKTSSRSKLKFEQCHMKLAELLLKKIRENNETFKQPDLEKWANTFRLMMESDKRDGKDIQDVIVWCQKDDFWQTNILSADKLRKQFDALYPKMKKGGTRNEANRNGKTTGWDNNAGWDIGF